MKFARFRRPLSVTTGRLRSGLFYLLLFCLSAVLAFVLFFPRALVEQRCSARISAESGVLTECRDLTLGLPARLSLALQMEAPHPQAAALNIERLTLTPVWSRLFSDVPLADLLVELGGGRVAGQVGTGGRSDLNIDAVELLPLQNANNPYRLSALLSGELQTDQLDLQRGGEGRFALRLDQARILGLDKLALPGDFVLGQILLEGALKGNRLVIEQVDVGQGALEVAGKGTLLIGKSPAHSRLNLNLTLRPTATTPGMLRDLLSLSGAKKEADGSFAMRVSGTLARPVVR